MTNEKHLHGEGEQAQSAATREPGNQPMKLPTDLPPLYNSIISIVFLYLNAFFVACGTQR